MRTSCFHPRNCRNAYDLWWPIIDRISGLVNRNGKQQKHRRLCNLLYTKCNLLKIYRNLIINMEICPPVGELKWRVESGWGGGNKSEMARECNKTINAKRSRCRTRSLRHCPPLHASSSVCCFHLLPPNASGQIRDGKCFHSCRSQDFDFKSNS